MFKKCFILILTVSMPWLLFAEQSSELEDDDVELIETLSEMTEEDRRYLQEFLCLDWKESGRHKLSNSNSSISLPEGYRLVLGEDAKKTRELNGSFRNDHIEAVVYDDLFDNFIVFENLESGYVSIDDWEEVDPSDLLREFIKNTEKANEEREEKGFPKIHVIGWIQEPTLDKHTNTVYWAIEGTDDDENGCVNSVALRLGRHGFEKLNWVTRKESYVPFGGHLDVMLRAHSFEPGSKYEDFVVGDKVAGYGIAALVAATVGGKIVKAGGLIIILKKICGPLLAALAFLLCKFRNIFKRDRKNK